MNMEISRDVHAGSIPKFTGNVDTLSRQKGGRGVAEKRSFGAEGGRTAKAAPPDRS
jgi:hypothetical protein